MAEAGVMKHKVGELEGALLDAAVAKAEGIWGDDTLRAIREHPGIYRPSQKWEFGGPIIEDALIEISGIEKGRWLATPNFPPVDEPGGGHHHLHAWGPTPLIAAMRAYVLIKLGEEVELP